MTHFFEKKKAQTDDGWLFIQLNIGFKRRKLETDEMFARMAVKVLMATFCMLTMIMYFIINE